MNILYGSSGGLKTEASEMWYQDLGIGGHRASELDDQFGFSVAAGDFNKDGYDDLAIGVPGETVLGDYNAGAVNILYGSSGGLKTDASQMWYQDLGIGGGSEPEDRFGSSVAAGDFNKDGYDDLAIGVPGEAIGTTTNAGAVNILYGSSSGLNTAAASVWYRDPADPENQFGSSVAAGDFNNDGYADLAVGVPGESIGGKVNAGAVNVLYGSSSGLKAANTVKITDRDVGIRVGSEIWYQDLGIGGHRASELDDQFGSSVAAGDFNKDGYDDLAIGVPGETVLGNYNAGAVNILYGSSGGLKTEASEMWYQDLGIGGSTEPEDRFGSSIDAGDFNKDGYDDLAIGVPGEAIGDKSGAGAVNVLYGSSSGLKAAKDIGIRSKDTGAWYQDLGIGDISEAGDQFGYSVAAGDFNNDSYDDLAIGVPGEAIDTKSNAGAVNVIYGKFRETPYQ